jgi:hypothetical protein
MTKFYKYNFGLKIWEKLVRGGTWQAFRRFTEEIDFGSLTCS